jgi:hypothetical protein
MKRNRRTTDKKDPKGYRMHSVAPSEGQARHPGSTHFSRGELIGEPFRSVVPGAVSFLLQEQIQGAQ